jgi:hypothetical protein
MVFSLKYDGSKSLLIPHKPHFNVFGTIANYHRDKIFIPCAFPLICDEVISAHRLILAIIRSDFAAVSQNFHRLLFLYNLTVNLTMALIANQISIPMIGWESFLQQTILLIYCRWNHWIFWYLPYHPEESNGKNPRRKRASEL